MQDRFKSDIASSSRSLKLASKNSPLSSKLASNSLKLNRSSLGSSIFPTRSGLRAEPGDSLSNAYNITDSSFKESDRVGDNEGNDYYRFNLTGKSKIEIEVDNKEFFLGPSLDFRLLDKNGNKIQSVNVDGSEDGELNRTLGKGTYYIKIESGGESVPYELKFKREAIDSNNDDTPGSSRSTALKITDNTFKKSDRVGEQQGDDYYRFDLTSKRNIDISVLNQESIFGPSLDFRLLDKKGKQIKARQVEGADEEDIERALNQGTYYILVESEGENVPYRLNYKNKSIDN